MALLRPSVQGKSIETHDDLMDADKNSFDLRQNKVSKLTVIAVSIDAANSCLNLVALLRQNKVSLLRLMTTSWTQTRTALTSDRTR